MCAAAPWQVVRGGQLVHVVRPQGQLLLAQLYSGSRRLGCHEEGRDGQREGLAVGFLHHLQRERGQRTELEVVAVTEGQ